MKKNSRIYVAGRDTMVGAAIIDELTRQGYKNIIGKTGEPADLTDRVQVETFIANNNPEYVFLTAGRSGGIEANQRYPADLMLDNLLVECHIIHNAYRYKAKKLLYLASSCCYPKYCQQPMKTEYLMTGLLEPTNEAYAISKIAGIKLCQAYRKQYGANFVVGIPANVFGQNDDFNPESSHVIAALIQKMHEAKKKDSLFVEIWGTGKPKREFIYTDDLADACIFLMKNYNSIEPINIGSSVELSIRDIAELVKTVVGYEGKLRFDANKPDGSPTKVLDSNRLKNMGWVTKSTFRAALEATYKSYIEKDQLGSAISKEMLALYAEKDI